MVVECFCRGMPAERLAVTIVEGCGDWDEAIGAMPAQVRAFGEVLPQQTVGILIRPSLPWTMGIAEVDRQARVDPELGVLSHLHSLVPGQRFAQVVWQHRNRGSNRVANRLGAMASESGSILRAEPMAVATHPGEVHQHRESSAALDQRPDR